MFSLNVLTLSQKTVKESNVNQLLTIYSNLFNTTEKLFDRDFVVNNERVKMSLLFYWFS